MNYLRFHAWVLWAAVGLAIIQGDLGAQQDGGLALPPLGRFLLPAGVGARMGLSEKQQVQVAQLERDFTQTNQAAIGSLPADLAASVQALRQARQQQDREAFGRAQQQVRPLLEQLTGLRAQFEPGLLALLTEEQKLRYRELKPELQRPAVVLGLAQPSAGERGRTEPAMPPVDTSKLTPLTDMGDANYQGFPGELYPDKKNKRPAAHEAAGRALASRIRALDAEGKPSPKGKIVLLTIGMSNTMRASAGFQEAARGDIELNPQVVIVNGAQGGETAEKIQDPNDHGSGEVFWRTVDDRLHSAGVSRAQVQVVWVKQADAAPNEGFPQYAQKLEAELTRIMQVLHQRFPNLKLVYLSSRTYGGFAKTRLNPEPYAYESGFAVKWLIEKQLKGDPELNFDSAKGPVTAPWLSWGPYLWANGTTPRADGLSYEPGDFRESDGTHESPAGQRKVGQELLRFFKTDTTTKSWFLKQ